MSIEKESKKSETNKKDINHPVADRLKVLRGAMTQQEAADIVKVSQATWGKWENGSMEPKAGAIYSIAKAFGVTMEYLFEVNDPPHLKISNNLDCARDVLLRAIEGVDFEGLVYLTNEAVRYKKVQLEPDLAKTEPTLKRANGE